MNFYRLSVLATIVLWLLLSSSCVHTRASLLNRKYPPAQLREDATLMKDVILQMHPGVGVYQSRTYYDSLFTHFITQLNDSLNERDFRLQVKLLLDHLRCGHTEVLYSTNYYREVNRQKWNYSPYIFLPVDDKAYVIANLGKNDSTLKRGMQVTRINALPVDSMLRYTKRFISADGWNQTARNYYAQLGFNSYYLGLFGRPDTFRVQYLEKGRLKETSYPAIQLRNLPPLPLGARDDSLFRKFRIARIQYRWLGENKKTMMMRIRRFSHNQDAYVYHRLFRKLKKNASENLVIDLRGNGGGSLSNCYRLLSYLVDQPVTQTLATRVKNYPHKKYTRGNMAFHFTRLAYSIIGKTYSSHDTDYFRYQIKLKTKLHFSGKIFVLINGGSFSASCLVGAYLLNNPRVAFIGEESGGALEGCNAGITPFYKLPHTGIRVRVPAFRVRHDVIGKLTGRGIMPDYAVEYGFRDIVSRKDLELAKVKEILKIK